MTKKLSGCTITCHFSFSEPQEEDGFSAYDFMRQWAYQEAACDEMHKTLYLDDQDLVSTKPWINLKPMSFKVFGDTFYQTNKDDEQNYRLHCEIHGGKISQDGYANYVRKRLHITYETLPSNDS